ncbi:MAG: dihydroorotate dehydrogenase-like protein [Verrucomicrobiota bacterium]
MADLQTNYLKLSLRNPVVPSASPLSGNIDNIRKMEDAGAGAMVLHSLFEEQINYDSQLLHETLEQGTESFAESTSYLPDMGKYKIGPERYLDLIRSAKEAVDMPIIASLNGCTLGGWIDYAKKIQEAGADALELNLYRLPTNPLITGSEIKSEYIEIVSDVLKHISIPLAVKISPFFSSIPYFATQLASVGARGLVMFNRFYQADIDLENFELVHRINYSASADLLLPLRWTAILYGQVKLDLAITSGVHNHEDVIKGIMAGANVTMMASALLQHGIPRIRTIIKDLERWMDEHEYNSIKEMRGCMSLKKVENPEKYERAQYLRVLDSFKPMTSKLRVG